MKIQFESQLEYQNHAINSIVNIFEGQEICQSNFTVTGINDNLLTYQNDLGIGNRLELLDDEILANVQNIQLKNGLPQTKSVKDIKTMDFSVEMETGTGKTYVYLKTIFKMNKKFGFTKFIIVVPSIAIKEGCFFFMIYRNFFAFNLSLNIMQQIDTFILRKTFYAVSTNIISFAVVICGLG